MGDNPKPKGKATFRFGSTRGIANKGLCGMRRLSLASIFRLG